MAPMPGCLSKIYSALWLQQFGAAGKDLHGVRFSNRFMRQLFFRRFISDQPGLLAGLRELEDAGLLLRVRQGFGEPNKIYVLIPRDAQKQDCGKDTEPV